MPEPNLPSTSLCCALVRVVGQSQSAQTLLLAEVRPRDVLSLLMGIQSIGPD